MEEQKSILHELYVYSEWKPEPEYMQKPDGILPENISVLWRWLRFFGAKKSLIDSVTLYKEFQQKWLIALGDQGKVIAVLTDNILEIRTKRSDYATIAARTTVNRDGYAQWRKLAWSPDCSFLALAYGNGVVSFFDLTASNLFNIPIECSRPGGLECTDTTHAVAEVIFMPLRVQDIKWHWEVLILTYDGKLRCYLVSQTDGFKLHHSFRFDGGVGAICYNATHSLLYVAGVPRVSHKDPTSPLRAGITAWRILNDEPFYTLSVVSDQLEPLTVDRFQVYMPYLATKNLEFIMSMVVCPDGSKLVCVHCNGDISIWQLPLLKQISRWPLRRQPQYDLDSPLLKNDKKEHNLMYNPCGMNWWTNTEIIVSRFNGGVTVCPIDDMQNILGKKPEFFQGAPQITAAFDGTFMALECESTVLPAKNTHSNESMEVVTDEDNTEDTFVVLTMEMLKSLLYTITDLEAFQPKPKKITVVSRIYRLLGVKSTTPQELFTRKIDGSKYQEALTLAEEFGLDSDLVYQQQWRRTHVSSDAINKYLSKVSKKIWVIRQCVDRLPETLPSADELLQFGLKLTNEEILKEINKDRVDNLVNAPEDITLEDLNAYSSELLRCRHAMLFYKERLRLYEAILKCEKSTYDKFEYERLRSSSIVNSSIEMAQEGRIDALTCLWPHIVSHKMRLEVLKNIPETLNPYEYRHLLPAHTQSECVNVVAREADDVTDWCRKRIFKSIWNSNWSEDMVQDADPSNSIELMNKLTCEWYDNRAREIERLSGLVSHAICLLNLAVERGVCASDTMFHLQTLDTLLYDLNILHVSLSELENMRFRDTSVLLMSKTTNDTYEFDLKTYLLPYLRRVESKEKSYKGRHGYFSLYLVTVCRDDLTFGLQALTSPVCEIDVYMRITVVERSIIEHESTDQLEVGFAMLNAVTTVADDSIDQKDLDEKRSKIQALLVAASILHRNHAEVTMSELVRVQNNARLVQRLLTKLTRDLLLREMLSPNLLKDLLELQEKFFNCISVELCYEIYASAMLTSGSAAMIKHVDDVIEWDSRTPRTGTLVPFARAVELVLEAAQEYFNSASSLTDPALEMAKRCLSVIREPVPKLQEEEDLITALVILASFGMYYLPIQVRLCEDRVSLINECLETNPYAYKERHKLLKLATLLRVAGEDEESRECLIVELVGKHAMAAGTRWGEAAEPAAVALESVMRLATLRYQPAAPLLRHVAHNEYTLCSSDMRRVLLAAAAASCDSKDLFDTLSDRLLVELTDLGEKLGVKFEISSSDPSITVIDDPDECADDEFADAIATPVTENKMFATELSRSKSVYSLLPEKNLSSFEYDLSDQSVHCQEFYRTLYPHHRVSADCYNYDRFATTDPHEKSNNIIRWYYGHHSIHYDVPLDLEKHVILDCSERTLYKDSPFSVMCLLRSMHDTEEMTKYMQRQTSPVAIGLVTYAALLKATAPRLNDAAYLTEPVLLLKEFLAHESSTSEYGALLRASFHKLVYKGHVDRLKSLGYSVNYMMYSTDEDYRKESILRLMRSDNKEHREAAFAISQKHNIAAIALWLHRAAYLINEPGSMPVSDVVSKLGDSSMLKVFKNDKKEALESLSDDVWSKLAGTNHNSLIYYFTLLKNIDDKLTVAAVPVGDHIKILKKAKATSQNLDYKMLLEPTSPDAVTAHVVSVMQPENAGVIMKLLRSLPPGLRLQLQLDTLFTQWLTTYFFAVSSGSTSNKKWMQQYRQCSSYFSKLSKDDLLCFISNTNFSAEAVQKVPSGTRILMIMQTVDYCQLEQENEHRGMNKSEMSWSQVAQELARWSRFLENFHSTTIQGIIGNYDEKQAPWCDIEMSHGEPSKMCSALSGLVMQTDIRVSSLVTVMQCLHVDLSLEQVFEHIANEYVSCLGDVETLVSRLTVFYKEGVTLSDALLQSVIALATYHELAPNKKICLISLSQKVDMQDSDIMKINSFTIELLRNEWPDNEYATSLSESQLQDEAGRREVFMTFLSVADTLQQKKALVDVLSCWPPAAHCQDRKTRSLHSEFLKKLLSSQEDCSYGQMIKLLLKWESLTNEEVEWLATDLTEAKSITTFIWILILSKNDAVKDNLNHYLDKHKALVHEMCLEDDLVKEILEEGLFIKIVPTCVYPHVLQYMSNYEATADEGNHEVPQLYNLAWAVQELVRAKFYAEAGSLEMLRKSIPVTLSGFTQSLLYCQKYLNSD